MRLIQVLPRVSIAQTLLSAGLAASSAGIAVAQAADPGPAAPPASAPAAGSDAVLTDWLAADIPSNTEAEKLIRGRLARALAQQSRLLLQRDQIYLGGLEAAKTLMLLAVRLDPENPYIWRLMLDLCASLEEGDDEAARLGSEALARLSRLDPTDEVIRLRRILDSISRRQTAEERIAAIEKLLEPDMLARIGRGVGARLAFELAILRQRIGDKAGFERELIRTLDLDPVYPEASEIAAGYFRMQAPGKAEEASALRTAVLANPARTPAALGLAALCLENGAYSAAAEILNVEAAVLETNMPDLEFDSLLADLTLALWGSGQPEVAFAVVKKRQEQVDRVLLMEYDRRGVPLATAQRREAKLPLSVALATNAAAIASVIGGDRAKVAVQNAAISSETQVLALERDKAPEGEIAAAALEAAFVQLWLEGSVQTATNFYDRAVKSSELEPVAKARFDGWFALRGGDAAKAKELFAPQADADLGSSLGLAVALETLGDRREAARRHLAIARSMPAAAIGLWSRARLRGIVGSDVDVLEGAKEIEAAAALPPEFYDLMSKGRERLLLRVKPRSFEVRAWDPMIFEIEFTNRSGWPMAISPDGPVLDNATISTAVNAAGRKVSVPAFSIVPIDRAFVIPPGETLSVPFDLSLTDVALAIRADPVNGALVSVH
ncbi:MAG: tetratricopeptide repeat protein, partial [Planctomycetota bacterium]